MVSRRVKAAVEDEIARLQQRTLKLQYQQYEKRLNDITKSNPEILPQVVQHAENLLGGRAANAAAASGVPAVERAPAAGIASPALKKARSRLDLESSSPALKEVAPDFPTDDTETVTPGEDNIPRCVTKVSNIAPKYMVHGMSMVEPVSLSKNSQRALCRKSAKLPSKETCQEYFEFYTMLDKDDDLPPPLRNMSTLVKSMARFNLKKKRPLREVTLPVQWSKLGNYVVVQPEQKGAPWQVKHQYFELVRDIPPSWNLSGPQSCYMERNFSDRRARLVNPNTWARYDVGVLFMDEIVAKSLNFEIICPEQELDEDDEHNTFDGIEKLGNTTKKGEASESSATKSGEAQGAATPREKFIVFRASEKAKPPPPSTT